MNSSFYIENEVYIVIPKDEYEIAILAGSDLSFDQVDDNVDVEVRYKDGRLYTATFFTIQNIKALFDKNKITGECGSGLYFYSTDMILVELLSIDVIVNTIENLITENFLDSAFELQKS
jgi:hypothetical protein